MANQPSQPIPVFQTADVPAGVTGHTASDIPKPKTIKKEENQMADVTEKDIFDLQTSIKDARHDIIRSTDSDTDRLQGDITSHNSLVMDRFFAVGRDTADLRAQVTGVGYQVRDGFVAAAKDAEINALKTQVEMAKQTTYLSDKIDAGNQRTTDLISALNDSNQNRMLVERNTELVAALNDGRWWRDWGNFRGNWDSNQQFVANRLNALDSQLQDTRQGMVNFGTMAGVGQTSTSNNVK